MKVMIDTNIIISAALNPQGTVATAFIKALTPPYQPVIRDYIVDELRRKSREKFPKRLTELEAFLFNALRVIRIVPTPEEEQSDEKKIRDVKDRPILRAIFLINFNIIQFISHIRGAERSYPLTGRADTSRPRPPRGSPRRADNPYRPR